MSKSCSTEGEATMSRPFSVSRTCGLDVHDPIPSYSSKEKLHEMQITFCTVERPRLWASVLGLG